jgi:V-type H+-transporting ATPase subunit F
LLAGIGHRTAQGSNFLIVKQDTQLPQVEDAFRTLSQRDDIGIILINQHIANDIRHVLKDYNATIPTVLEIPSKEHPYDPEQDYIMQRVSKWPYFILLFMFVVDLLIFKMVPTSFINFVCSLSFYSTTDMFLGGGL